MISIIVPYRNAAAWIERCANSLKRQAGDFEYIFIDDHSDDGGDALLEKVADSRFILMENQHSAGVSGARNTGIDNAKGEWITFLDADDELMPNAWYKFSEALKVKAGMHQFNHIRNYITKPLMNRRSNRYDNAPGMYDLDNLPQAWFGVWNKLYKRELINDIRFDESMQYGEDELFDLECLAKSGRIHHGDSATVRHNIENMQSLSHIRTDEDLIKEIQKLLDFLSTHKDARLRRVVYDLIVTHLGSSWYKRAICEA